MSGINESNGQNEEEKRTEINEEIYRTPDVTRSEETEETTEAVETVETVEAEVVTDEESASLPEQSGIRPYGGYSENSQYYSGYPNSGQSGSSYLGSQPNNGQPYNNYAGGQSYNGYQGGSQPNSGQPYNNYPNSGQPYNNYPGGQSYNGYPGGQPNNGQPYNNYSGSQPNSGQFHSSYANSNQPGGQPNNSQFSNGYANSNQPGGQPNNGQPYNNYFGSQPAQSSNGSGYQPYGGGSSNVPPYNNGQYSPFATPPKKNKNGLVIGIVVGVIVLFLIGVFAFAYIMYSRLAESAYHERESSQSGRDYDFDDDIRTPKRENKDDDDYDSYDYYDDDYDDYYDDDYYDDYYDDDYYDNDDYYDFHDAIDYSLSYSVEFDEYYEGTENGNSIIQIIYPIISGDDVPHLEVLNETLQDEVEYLKDVFWENAGDSEEDSMYVMAEAYVTYMDEEKLSIVYQETVYSYDDMYEAYLFCVNFDMEKGLVLDNQDILSLDDDFSVDFRQRSDEQNGEISSLTSMSDQEITEYFNSDDVIVFYTPLGMEIGFNYYDGWVTVTYKEYQQYLKVS